MAKDFFAAIKERRSVYGITAKSGISDERLAEIIGDAVLHAPTPFNCQSARVLLLLGKHHESLWEITKNALKPLVKPEGWETTEKKIASFASGYGTVLYFNDDQVIADLQEKFPSYKDSFPAWAEQAGGILQHMVWVSLHVEGLGASLQHYNPLIDEEVKKTWPVSANWRLIAQMPFGLPEGSPAEKSFMPIEERFTVFS